MKNEGINDCEWRSGTRHNVLIALNDLQRLVNWTWWWWRRLPIDMWLVIVIHSNQYLPSIVRCKQLNHKKFIYSHRKTLNHRSIVPFYELQSSRGYFTLFSFILWLLEAFNDKSTTIKHTIKWLQNETPSTHMNVNAPLLQPVRWAYQIIKLAKICTAKRKICKHCSDWGISKT